MKANFTLGEEGERVEDCQAEKTGQKLVTWETQVKRTIQREMKMENGEITSKDDLERTKDNCITINKNKGKVQCK